MIRKAISTARHLAATSATLFAFGLIGAIVYAQFVRNATGLSFDLDLQEGDL